MAQGVGAPAPAPNLCRRVPHDSNYADVLLWWQLGELVMIDLGNVLNTKDKQLGFSDGRKKNYAVLVSHSPSCKTLVNFRYLRV